MPRYLVERLFPGGLELPPNQQGVQAAQKVIATNAEHGVTWVHSYVTPDKKKTFCIYDAPPQRPSGRLPAATVCRWTGSPRYGSSTPYFFL